MSSMKQLSVSPVQVPVTLLVIFSAVIFNFCASQPQSARNLGIVDPRRGTIIYRNRNYQGPVISDSNTSFEDEVNQRQIAGLSKGRLSRNRKSSPRACECMGYWDCIDNNGHVYSYCGIGDSEVCCFYLKKKDVKLNNGNDSAIISNNAKLSSSFVPTEVITESQQQSQTTFNPTYAERELFTAGNDFASVTTTPSSFEASLLPSALTDVDRFFAFENEDLIRRTTSTISASQSQADDKHRQLNKICGRQTVDWKLDSQAQFREWPWHIALLEVNKGLYVCGGTLISSDRIISAAHCLYPYANSNSVRLKIRAGEYDVSSNEEPDPYYEVLVEQIIIHPGYDNATLVNDIAMLKLEKPLNFTNNVRPICLPFYNEREDLKRVGGRKCIVAGWGRISETSPFSVRLKEIVVPLWDQRQCQAQLQKNFGLSYTLSETAICAGEMGHDACDGDGGGGLVCYNEERSIWNVIGIVSFGIGCGRLQNPGVYTNIFPFLEWINAFHYLQS